MQCFLEDPSEVFQHSSFMWDDYIIGVFCFSPMFDSPDLLLGLVDVLMKVHSGYPQTFMAFLRSPSTLSLDSVLIISSWVLVGGRSQNTDLCG